MKRQETSGNLVMRPFSSCVLSSPLLIKRKKAKTGSNRPRLTVDERRRLWQQHQSATAESREDVGKAGNIDMSTVYKIPLLVLSVNPVKNKSDKSKTNNMVQALVLPLEECSDVDQEKVGYDEDSGRHYLHICKDTWNSDQRDLLKQGKIADNTEEYNIDAVLGDTVNGTPKKRYVFKRIYELSVINFNDQAKTMNVSNMDYTVASINPLIWHKKEENAQTGVTMRTISQMVIGKSYDKVRNVPPTQLFSWIHDGDRWTHSFFTSYPKWNDYEREQGGDPDRKSQESKKVIYSNDTFVFPMGMRNEEGMNPRFMSQREAGDCMLTWEVADNDPELFKRKTISGEETPLLSMQYMLQQWRKGPRENPGFEKGSDLSAIISMIAMEDTLKPLYMPMTDVWLAIIPQIAGRIPAIVFAVENRMRTAKSQITLENQPDGVNDAGLSLERRIALANQPKADGHASFELNLFSKNIVFDLPRFLLTTGVPVTPETVKKVYGGALVRPKSSKTAYGAFTLQQVVNSEVIPIDSLKPETDLSHILKDDLLMPKNKSFAAAQQENSARGKYSLRMLMSYEPHEPSEELWDRVAQMTPEQGDTFFDYLNEGVFPRKGKSYLQQHADKFPKDSPANEGWSTKSKTTAYYMFYLVNIGAIEENVRSAVKHTSLTLDSDNNTMPLRIEASPTAYAPSQAANEKGADDNATTRKRSLSDGGESRGERTKFARKQTTESAK